MSLRFPAAILALALVGHVSAAPAGAAKNADPAKSAARAAVAAPFWTGHPDAAAFARIEDQRLLRAQQAVDRMIAIRRKRTIDNTLRPYDDALLELNAAGSQAGLMENVHPDSSVRDSAEKASQRVSAFSTALSLNRAVYDALAALDLGGADDETRVWLDDTKKHSDTLLTHVVWTFKKPNWATFSVLR